MVPEVSGDAPDAAGEIERGRSSCVRRTKGAGSVRTDGCAAAVFMISDLTVSVSEE